MPFQPGQSGNPGGMHKGTAELKALARQHAAAAIETLANIMLDSGAPPPARVAAANSLLDRGWGKPVQEIDHGSSQDNPLKIEITWQKE
jgi:hypothetical protein